MPKAARATGAEIWDFWKNGFPEDHYIDECEVDVDDDDGKCLLDLTAIYDLNDLGIIIRESDGEYRTFKDVFNEWQLKQSKVTLCVRFPRNRDAEIRVLFKTLDIEVLS